MPQTSTKIHQNFMDTFQVGEPKCGVRRTVVPRGFVLINKYSVKWTIHVFDVFHKMYFDIDYFAASAPPIKKINLYKKLSGGPEAPRQLYCV